MLERGLAAVAVTDANGLGYIGDEDLAIADSAGLGGPGKSLDYFFAAAGRHHHFYLDLGQQIDLVFLSAISFFVSFLASVAADFRYGHAIDPDGHQRRLDFIKFERLNDRLDLLHLFTLYEAHSARQFGHAHMRPRRDDRFVRLLDDQGRRR